MNFNERTNTLLYKNIHLSHFIHERVDVSVVCEKWMERHTFRERTPSSHTFFHSGCPLWPSEKEAKHKLQLWRLEYLHIPRQTYSSRTQNSTRRSFSLKVQYINCCSEWNSSCRIHPVRGSRRGYAFFCFGKSEQENCQSGVGFAIKLDLTKSLSSLTKGI